MKICNAEGEMVEGAFDADLVVLQLFYALHRVFECGFDLSHSRDESPDVSVLSRQTLPPGPGAAFRAAGGAGDIGSRLQVCHGFVSLRCGRFEDDA